MVTISSCPQTVTDCPYRTAPVTTVIVESYTTKCSSKEDSTSAGKTAAKSVYPVISQAAVTASPTGEALATQNSTYVATPSNGTSTPIVAGAPVHKFGGSVVALAIGVVALL